MNKKKTKQTNEQKTKKGNPSKQQQLCLYLISMTANIDMINMLELEPFSFRINSHGGLW